MSKSWLAPSIALLVLLSAFGESSQAYTQQGQRDILPLPLNSQIAKRPRIRLPRRRGSQIRNPRNVINLNLNGRGYNPIPKHQGGGAGTLMDLDEQTAQRVLKRGFPLGTRVYSYHNRRFYRFDYENRTDNANNGFFHGYPVEMNQVPANTRKLMKKSGILD
ncbi:hypothetical protein [Allocoleopsis sp.]|uniref:hypothetical protein n=1 Tax=Allocoleopsis sp. TaxID=3088169 RepID=UPI002FCFFA0E